MRFRKNMREHPQTGMPVVGSTQPGAQVVEDAVKFVLADSAKVDALGHVLADAFIWISSIIRVVRSPGPPAEAL